ncbi:MAG TPA: glycosyltransferase [Candidatus Omnitrophota bacterium]|nr:glycosyltransferase [Candidatus Omnitrophota bacterium]HPS36512.1 glycosyltransferase [Candidatus Omnitrophota bacterium]
MGVKISVVMPVYNAGLLISKALKSIADQERLLDEVVIVNDGSVDNTLEEIDKWRSRLPIKLINNDQRLGVTPSLRKGVDSATSELVLRLDHDDYWLPDHSRWMSKLAEDSSQAAIFCSRATVVNEEGKELATTPNMTDAAVRPLLMWDNPLTASATGFWKEKYTQVGGYHADELWEDYDLWLRLLCEGPLFFTGKATVVYRTSNSSISRVKRSTAIKERWRCQRRAIRLFWRRYPLEALRCFVLGGVRFALSNIR